MIYSVSSFSVFKSCSVFADSVNSVPCIRQLGEHAVGRVREGFVSQSVGRTSPQFTEQLCAYAAFTSDVITGDKWSTQLVLSLAYQKMNCCQKSEC